MKGYKTIIFNTLMTVVAVVKALNPDTEAPSAEDLQAAVDSVDAAIAAVWGIGNVILRAITNSPIFNKDPEIK